MLAKVLAQMNYGGCVAACGLAGGFALPTTVMPFILRNVRLQGVDSVMSPAERRAEAQERLVQDLPASFYEQSATEITLSQRQSSPIKSWTTSSTVVRWLKSPNLQIFVTYSR